MDLEENADLETMEEESFGAEDDLEDATFSGDVCVICTGAVTERGILDCCQHWFCYECIEQWAAFSSHCPICKINFHSITFLLVDDTSDCVEGEESAFSIGDDDWYLKEGEMDTLFFPANYINEENVKCLHGAGCKIQSGLAIYGDSVSDTSVACDSCENWYHAICVDFDPNCNHAGAWICPRCASETGKVKPVLTSKDSPKANSDFEVGNVAPSSFPGNVSVSIDDGETAVVVSFHKGSTDNCPKEKESELELLPKESEMFSEVENIPLVLSPRSEHASDKSMLSGSNLNSGKNEEIEIEVCDGSVVLESKSDVHKVLSNDVDMVDTRDQETKADILVTENSNNASQQPIELPGRFTKRRYSEVMMEPVAVSKKAKLTSTDIMSVVTEQRSRASNKENANSGVRTRKIMRNPEGEKKPEDLVDKLQTEIKSLKSSINDDSLLKAVRAVITTNKAGPSVVRPKRSIVQAGKARQNLMKKIYSTAGRRRPAWQRDCEVEFWKYRCNSRVDQEKIENLQSILDLLKKGSTWSELCQGQNEEDKSSVLSRVYLADASVLPRKDDIKPLCDTKGASVEKSDQNKLENADKPRVVPLKKASKIMVGKGLTNQEKKENQSGEIVVDKRKWALEVLARKNASSGSGSNKEKSEDGFLLKGTYPLLAQLPVDMRPVLAASRQNKVPMTVRQAQLYRITELFLRRANLTSIDRSAETELAVADAVNIEKDIFERSNSKLVYLNLISQSLHQYTNKSVSHEVERTEKFEKTECADSDGDVQKANNDDVEKALRMAGLLSDSPPNSPERNDANVENNSVKREAVLVCTGTREMQDGQRKEPNDSDNPDLLRDIVQLHNHLGPTLASSISDQKEDSGRPTLVHSISDQMEDSGRPTLASSISDQKEDSGIPKNDSVVVKTSENEELDLKKTSDGETCDMKNHDKNKNAKKDSSGNNNRGEDGREGCESEGESCAVSKSFSCKQEKLRCSPSHSIVCENVPKGEKPREPVNQKPSDSALSISKKVEAYVKEHIRPLCKSGVISGTQYRWAVAKTTEKIMKYHQKEKSANFLIKEGDKVKKLAEQYVEAAQKMG